MARKRLPAETAASLFAATARAAQPLAARMRPRTLEEFAGVFAGVALAIVPAEAPVRDDDPAVARAPFGSRITIWSAAPPVA